MVAGFIYIENGLKARPHIDQQTNKKHTPNVITSTKKKLKKAAEKMLKNMLTYSPVRSLTLKFYKVDDNK